MKILILGIDGYIGYSLALHLLKQGHTVFGLDNSSRRRRVHSVGGDSLTPIKTMMERDAYLQHVFNNYGGMWTHTLGVDRHSALYRLLVECEPDTIVHLAEQPSAPYSMKGIQYAYSTQMENILGTLQLLWIMYEVCPEAHLVKLGTMGEYGTPNCVIPEGRVPKECLHQEFELVDFSGSYGSAVKGSCPMSGLLFPRTPGSFYHLTKVHDTFNIEFACRTWELRSTDIMQGVVYGLNDANGEDEFTRFDYDECFGTVINRFCTEAISGHPLTVYGAGGQTRGYLPLKDSIQCLTIAIENPAKSGEYRTLNQFAKTFSINQLAAMVFDIAEDMNLKPKIDHILNPRVEAEEHYYNPDHRKLSNLGYEPTINHLNEIRKLIEQLLPYKDFIRKDLLMPKITWT